MADSKCRAGRGGGVVEEGGAVRNFQSGTSTYLTTRVKNYSMMYANRDDSGQPVYRVF